MAFVNEYISDEDVKKYGIDEIWSRYHGDGPKLPGFRYSWTIDRALNAFVMSVKTGREELSNRVTFVLWLSGNTNELQLDKLGTGDLKEPVTTIWKLAQISISPGVDKSREEIVAITKAALSAYKVDGIWWPVNNHTAIFKF